MWWNVLFAVVVGVTVGIAGFLVIKRQGGNFWRKRAAEADVNTLISTTAMVIILILANLLANKYSWRIDLTETKLYTLSPQTQQVLKSLSEPIRVYVFDWPPNGYDRQLLKNYARHSKYFSFDFIDPQVNLSLAQKFQVDRKGNVYIQWRDKRQLVQTVSPQSRLEENKLTNAIVKIRRETTPVVYIIQGHGEPSLDPATQPSFSQAVKTLNDNGYIVKPLNLGQSPLIPPDASVLIVSSGDRNILPGEEKIIQKYLEKGGNILIMVNASSEVPLAKTLSQWGVKLHDSIVVDPSGTGETLGLGPSVTIITNYGQHPITRDFNNGLTILPWARPIITENKPAIEKTPLLITHHQSWGETNLEGEQVLFDPTKDKKGPLEIAVALVRKNSNTRTQVQQKNTSTPTNTPVKPETKNKGDLPPPPINPPKPDNIPLVTTQPSKDTTKMVVVGNANFATDGWFLQQLNQDFLLNAISWLANEDEQLLSIRPIEAVNRRLRPTPLQVQILWWLALVILPLMALIIAFVTWWQRSRLS
ncbi:MAG: Gldg family protein [Geminocystis sp.]|nr:Gldg family protein [Geminocystis sp.]MCX8079533.1 Gldg family protein [Geminocystis sp.]MDW8116803.1 Gldg family protein [Geminocystis sp.]